MTEQMKRTLRLASTSVGAAGSSLTFEARRMGWVVFFKHNQNSITFRYKITEAGKAALEAAA